MQYSIESKLKAEWGEALQPGCVLHTSSFCLLSSGCLYLPISNATERAKTGPVTAAASPSAGHCQQLPLLLSQGRQLSSSCSKGYAISSENVIIRRPAEQL